MQVFDQLWLLATSPLEAAVAVQQALENAFAKPFAATHQEPVRQILQLLYRSKQGAQLSFKQALELDVVPVRETTSKKHTLHYFWPDLPLATAYRYTFHSIMLGQAIGLAFPGCNASFLDTKQV